MPMRKLPKRKNARKDAHDGGLEAPGYRNGTTHKRAKAVEATTTKKFTERTPRQARRKKHQRRETRESESTWTTKFKTKTPRKIREQS